MVKHNFWSVKGYLKKKEKKICVKILPNVLKNRVFEKEKKLIRLKKP